VTDLSNRPLLSEGPDRELFVPREPAFSLLQRGVSAGLNALVTAPAGSGKTTLLHMLQRNLRDERYAKPAVFVSGSLARDADELLDFIGQEVAHATPARIHLPATGAESEARRVLDRVRALRTQQAALIFIDDVPSAEVGRTVFGRLRDELWQAPHQWVVTARSELDEALTQPPADAFFELKVKLPPLSQSQIEELLARRGVDHLSPSMIAQIVEQSDGIPLAVLSLARQLMLNPMDAQRLLTERARREAEASKLGRAASMLVAELEQRGAVSASDKQLLDSLGWTRSRATQVLRDLEKAGLARSFPGAANNRKLYELVDPVFR
jgi:ATP/maltotriose-dependent transcriptional regulator MalT